MKTKLYIVIIAICCHANVVSYAQQKTLQEHMTSKPEEAKPVVAKLSKLKVKGKDIVDEAGNVVVLKGLDTSDPDKLQKDGHWNTDYFAEMKRWGANVARFPIHPRAWRERGKEAYLKLLDEGIKLAEENGLYVILDWHSIGNLKSEMFFLDMYDTSKKETFAFWRTMAEKYGNNPTVAVFELFNEPTTFNEKLGTCTWEEWRAINEELITMIRANGSKNIPLVSGFNWGYDLTPVAFSPIRAEGIAYASHPYPQKRPKPWEDIWTKDWGFVADRYPLILTEIGFCGADDPGAHIPVISDESYGDAITKYCADIGISYTLWVFDPQWAPRMFEDWTYKPSRQGRYWKTALSKK
jgi:endoglucanase